MPGPQENVWIMNEGSSTFLRGLFYIILKFKENNIFVKFLLGETYN